MSSTVRPVQNMEVLSAVTFPQVLHIARETVLFAWTLYNSVTDRKAECKVLLERCNDLILEVGKQVDGEDFSDVMSESLHDLECACLAVQIAVTTLASKSFSWRLLHQSKIARVISQAQTAVSDASANFNVGAHLTVIRLQRELADARERDQQELSSNLNKLSRNDHKILSALQAHGRDQLRLEELVIALTKHVQALQRSPDKPADIFIRTAAGALQRLSNFGIPYIPRWSLTSLEVNFDRSDEESCVGRGSFGCIFKGEWDGQVVAVKEMHRSSARELDRRNLELFRGEIALWSQLAHPHVLPFYGACLEATQPFIVSQLCENGNVLEFLRVNPEADRVSIMHEICLGMVYLHKNSVVHADLKASNILIGDDRRALIADFGLSFCQGQAFNNHIPTSTPHGALRWMAPEQLLGQKPDKPGDVYSFALTAWEIFTGGNVPFSNVPDKQALIDHVVKNGMRPGRPACLAKNDNERLWRVLTECWTGKATARPKFANVASRLKVFVTRSNITAVVPKPLVIEDAAASPCNFYHQPTMTHEKEITARSSQYVSDRPLPHLRNVVVFGDSGVGKSSVVNMLAGKDVFKADAGVCGTSFRKQGCVVKFGQQPMNVYDITGLGEVVAAADHNNNNNAPREAFLRLYDLLHDLGRVSVVVFVTRFRITSSTLGSYRIMRGMLGGERVPVVIAITGREHERDNERWWAANEGVFVQKGMVFDEYAIGTAGGRFVGEPTYAEMRTRLQGAIEKYGRQIRARYVPAGEEVAGERVRVQQGEGRLHRWFENAVVQVMGRLLGEMGVRKDELLRVYEEVLESHGVRADRMVQSVERVRLRVGVVG